MPLVATVGETGEASSSVFDEGRVEWKVENFFKLSEKIDDFYESPVFSFANEEWYMRIYPNGQQSWNSSGRLGLYLRRKRSGKPKIVYYDFGIKNSNGEIEEEVQIEKSSKREFSTEGLGYGSRNFWSRSDLSNRKDILLPDNVLTVTCRLRSERSSDSDEEKVLHALRNMLVSGDDSDVVMEVQGKEFPAHRAILRARSPVFRSMFEHNMAEKQSNVVNIKDNDPETFQDFLIYIYSGSCEKISTENVFSLFTTADKYDMGGLRVTCANFMVNNLSVANFCDVLALAVRHNEQELIEKATEFFCKNSLEIVKTVEWQIFQKENLTVGNELFIKALSK